LSSDIVSSTRNANSRAQWRDFPYRPALCDGALIYDKAGPPATFVAKRLE
jgi:hypothetical protein